MLSKFIIETNKDYDIIDVGPRIGEIVKTCNVKDGIAIVYSPHTACGVVVTENTDPDLKQDLIREMGMLFPKGDPRYTHSGGNADAHIKTALTGVSVSIIIEDRKLLLGKWQSIYLCEFDGPKARQLFVKILAG